MECNLLIPWEVVLKVTEVSLQAGVEKRHIHQFVRAQFSLSVVSESLQPHKSQHARPSCSSPTPGVHLNSCPMSQ